MKISVGKYIGTDQVIFEIEGSDLKDALEKASKFTDSSRKGNLPESCGLCGDKNLVLTSYRTREKNFLYVKIVCRNKECQGFSELGQNTKTTEFYWKPFEKYVSASGQQSDKPHENAEPTKPSPEDVPADEDDLPF